MDIDDLIAECTAYDFKAMLEEKKPKSWLKSVSAFANGTGGSLIFGVENDRQICGLDDVQHVCESVSSFMRDRLDPLPETDLMPVEINGKHVVVLKVHSGKYTPYYYVGDNQRIAFVRVGNESIPVTDEQMLRLVLKGTNRTFDSLHTSYPQNEHSFSILANTFKKRTAQAWDSKFLKSFGLVTDDGMLTNAGALFADDCPVVQSRLYCTRWNSNEKDDAINDAEYTGNILMLLREALNFVKSNTINGWEKLPNGRKNHHEYAERAVLEGLVNHFIHRDYTVIGGEVHLDIYNDRLTLTSPGGMYSGQMIQDLDISDVPSDRRNPVLADVMAQLDYMEKRGSGLKRICKATCELDGYSDNLKPKFKSTVSHFMTTLYKIDISAKQNQEWIANGQQTDNKRTANGQQRELLSMLLEGERPITDLMEFLGYKKRESLRKYILNDLLTDGYVEMTHPENPSHRNQRYRITDKGRNEIESANGK